MIQETDINIYDIYNLYGDWYLQTGNMEQALNYYNKIKNYDIILSSIQMYPDKIISVNSNTIFNIFKDIPDVKKMEYPLAYIVFIQFYITMIDYTEGKRLFYEMKNLYKKSDSYILGEIAILEALINFKDLNLSIDYLKKAYNIFNGEVTKISYREIIFTLGTPSSIRTYHRNLGNLNTILKLLENEFCKYSQSIINDDLGYSYLVKAEYCYEIGNLNTAEILAQKSLSIAGSKEQTNLVISSIYTLIRIYILKSKTELIYKYIYKLTNIILQATNLIIIADAELVINYIYSCIGQLDKISQWICNYDLTNCNTFAKEICWLIYGKSICLKKNFIKLEMLSENVIDNNDNFIFYNIFAYIFNAIAKYNIYGIDEAKVPLLKAVNLAKQDNIIMPFVENAIDLLPLLYKIDNEYISNLLPLCEKFEFGVNALNSKNPLTQREKQIINLVAEGYKNSEIGKTLGIANVTVEKSLSNIYKKLNVKNRTAAISKIKKYGFP